MRSDLGTIAAGSSGNLTTSASSWSEQDVFLGTILNRNADTQTVIDAQFVVAAADANVFTVDGTTGLGAWTNDDWSESGVHYDTTGQVSVPTPTTAAWGLLIFRGLALIRQTV